MTWLQTQKLFPKNVWEPPAPTFEKGANAPTENIYIPGKRLFINQGSLPAVEKIAGEPMTPELVKRCEHLIYRFDDKWTHTYYARVSFRTHEEAIALFERLHNAFNQAAWEFVFSDLDIQIQPKKIQIETPDVRLFRLLTNIWVRDPSVYCGYIEMNCDRYNIRKWLVRSPLRR
jgi:hypothetical protein